MVGTTRMPDSHSTMLYVSNFPSALYVRTYIDGAWQSEGNKPLERKKKHELLAPREHD
jgi:hypothetical protein